MIREIPGELAEPVDVSLLVDHVVVDDNDRDRLVPVPLERRSELRDRPEIGAAMDRDRVVASGEKAQPFGNDVGDALAAHVRDVQNNLIDPVRLVEDRVEAPETEVNAGGRGRHRHDRARAHRHTGLIEVPDPLKLVGPDALDPGVSHPVPREVPLKQQEEDAEDPYPSERPHVIPPPVI